MTRLRLEGKSPLVLALDVGTSSCRASLYDARARRLSNVIGQIAYSPRITPDGGAELDAEALFRTVTEAIDYVAQGAAEQMAEVRAVGACTFWHSLLGLDESFNPITPVYIWLDARSRAQADSLKEQIDERSTHSRVGTVFHWSYLPAKLLWLQETNPRLFAQVRYFVSFGDLVYYRLFGELRTGVSMASGSGLMNQHTRDWDDRLLSDLVGIGLPIRRDQLPPIEKSCGAFSVLRGEYAARWPTLASIPWLPALGDGACSNLGAGCATRERFALMVGTSGAIRALWQADDITIPWGAWCYHADSSRFVLGAVLNDGGSLLSWLRQSLQLPSGERLEREISEITPCSHGLTILPYWGGERSPGWAADARGAVIGARLHTTPVDIYRAALEAVALHFARLDSILRESVPEVRQVVATGAALLSSPTWMQIMADALGHEVVASTEAEASSRGAALMALECLGALPGGIEAVPTPIGRAYEPIPSHHERYKVAGARQKRLYDLLIAGEEMAPL